MDWLANLLKEFPALSVARERLALVEERFRNVESENQRLRNENERLIAERSALQAQGNTLQRQDEFIEERGVLWKRKRDGRVDAFPYCPACRFVLSAFPPPPADEMLACSKCNFIAPFPPSEARTIASSLK
jgi:hypothetical protein